MCLYRNNVQSQKADLAPSAATWRTGRNTRRVVFDSGLFPALYENMTSSIKPEVHNVPHCHVNGQTDRQTDRQTDSHDDHDIWDPVDTQYNKIANYTDTEQVIACTSLLEQNNSPLANVDFALCITVLQLGSPNSVNMVETLLSWSKPNNTFRHLT